jgi:hypothetical protein
VLVPAALVWTMAVAGVRVLSNEVQDRRTLLLVVLGVFAAAALAYAFLPGKQDEDEDGVETLDDLTDDIVPMDEGGYPVPPLDLVVPPTPRSLARARQTASVGGGTAGAGPAAAPVPGAPAAPGGVVGVDATERMTGVTPGDLERGTETSSPHHQPGQSEEGDRG